MNNISTLSLAERTQGNLPSYLGHEVEVVTRCDDEACEWHRRGQFTLVAPEEDRWLVLSDDSRVAWLSKDTRVLTNPGYPDLGDHVLPEFAPAVLSAEEVAAAIETLLQGSTVDKKKATPGERYVGYSPCNTCRLLRIEEDLCLPTPEAVLAYKGQLAVLYGPARGIIGTVLTAGRARCTCSKE